MPLGFLAIVAWGVFGVAVTLGYLLWELNGWVVGGAVLAAVGSVGVFWKKAMLVAETKLEIISRVTCLLAFSIKIGGHYEPGQYVPGHWVGKPMK